MTPSDGARVGVLLAGDGEDWERPALDVLQGGSSDLVLLRRCLDLTELLAAATSGTAQVAVVGHRSHGLDRDAAALTQAIAAEHCTAGGICVIASHQPFALTGMERLDLAGFAA